MRPVRYGFETERTYTIIIIILYTARTVGDAVERDLRCRYCATVAATESSDRNATTDRFVCGMLRRVMRRRSTGVLLAILCRERAKNAKKRKKETKKRAYPNRFCRATHIGGTAHPYCQLMSTFERSVRQGRHAICFAIRQQPLGRLSGETFLRRLSVIIIVEKWLRSCGFLLFGWSPHAIGTGFIFERNNIMWATQWRSDTRAYRHQTFRNRNRFCAGWFTLPRAHN